MVKITIKIKTIIITTGLCRAYGKMMSQVSLGLDRHEQSISEMFMHHTFMDPPNQVLLTSFEILLRTKIAVNIERIFQRKDYLFRKIMY